MKSVHSEGYRPSFIYQFNYYGLEEYYFMGTYSPLEFDNKEENRNIVAVFTVKWKI